MSKLTAVLFFSFLNLVALQIEAQIRSVQNFDRGWKFSLGAEPKASNESFDDAGWRLLNLPHDWSIEGSFDEKNPSGQGGGALPGGTGWYRKTFLVPASATGKSIFIDFGGVYKNSEVWINGKLLGIRPNGYISFRYDLTPYLRYGKNNTIAVKADNSDQPNSRWYSGSGIYRSVYLVTTGKVMVDNWGTYVTTPEVSQQSAKINIQTKIRNTSGESGKASLVTTLYSPAGKVVRTIVSSFFLPKHSKYISQSLMVSNPTLWSDQVPALYKAVSTNLLNFNVQWPAEIAGVDNGLQTSMESFTANSRKAFNGLALVIVRSMESAGKIVLTVSSAGLPDSTIVIMSNEGGKS